ncbi:MAG: ATP-dependent zinc protease [Candidatus Moraniibacteriota bacterium]|nr:MAG: ATP-dependent zinc protease [Candidatus Moranbacteria bacterium]
MFDFFHKSKSVLGMNARNLHFIRPNNLRKARILADNKLLSKKLFKKHGLPVPDLITSIKTHKDLEQFNWESLPSTFVLKPNRGFGGGGILVVYAKSKKDPLTWIKADGSKVGMYDLKEHIHNILDGSFSLSGTSDTAFFEERMRLSKTFKPYTFKGIPDIRVIVFNNVPVMAMLRLPTKESEGKANLQQGALGLGIDMASGVTTTAVYGKKARPVEYLPGTEMPLSGIKIPHWTEILHLAIEAQKVSGLGFLGADIAIDREKGPVFLELNSRPGLQIQVANRSGLRERLDRVAGLKIKSVEHGTRVGKNLFGGEIEESLEEISGRKVIGTMEMIQLFGRNNRQIEVKAKIDTGAYSTSIDTDLAKKLGFEKTLEIFEKLTADEIFNIQNSKYGRILEKQIFEKYHDKIPHLEDVSLVFSATGVSLRPVVLVEFIMNERNIASKLNISSREHLKYPVLIGRRDLKKFLIEVK